MTLFAFDLLQKFEAVPHGWKSFPNSSDTQHRYNKYHLLTEFEVRTVSYGPSFFSFFPLRGKKGGSVTYSTDQEDEVSKIFIISLLCPTGSGRILSMRNGFKSLKQVESERSQFEIVFKSLARFSTQFRVKESFKPLLAK